MSWSITINDLPSFEGYTEDQEKFFAEQHHLYAQDAGLALEVAQQSNLASCTLSGGRTPDPYHVGDEHVAISIVGFKQSPDFIGSMRNIINQGPDDSVTEASAKRLADYLERVHAAEEHEDYDYEDD